MPSRRKFMKIVSAAAAGSFAATRTAAARVPTIGGTRLVSRANKTLLGENVYVFDPDMPAGAIDQIAGAVFRKMESNQFASQGYALLFRPGTYG